MKKFIVFVLMIFLATGCGDNGKKENKKKAESNIPSPVTLHQTVNSGNSAEGTINQQKTGKYKVTFIELGSVRCIPCKMMMPIMKEIEEKYGDEVKVVFYDVWTEEGKPYAWQYGIRGIPTQVFLDENGKEFHRHMGFYPKEQLFEVLKKKGVKID